MPHVAKTRRLTPLLIAGFVWGLFAPAARADETLDAGMHHLNPISQREWEDFPAKAEDARLVLPFQSKANTAEKTLRLRHRDLKQEWKVSLNGKQIAKLPQDENAMLTYWAVPPGTLKEGANEMIVSCGANVADDVMVGDIALLDLTRSQALSESALDVAVTDKETGKPLPCRITIADAQGSLVGLGTESGADLAVRPGVVYTATGNAAVRLPAGKYRVYAGRGFEYGIDSAEVDVKRGATAEVKLSIGREVPTPGYVACDTHIHTLTYSRHGDATLRERMITLAGEGVELAVATDHNLQIDYEPAAKAAGVRGYFTPVIGNEVTTTTAGHFNVFPIPPGEKLINWRARDWAAVARNIADVAPDGPLVVLNHARDVHGGFRPFDPRRHVALTGEDLDGWQLPANAMEVVNSGAVMTDPMRLVHDWMGLLNRGVTIAPIGASDSHDVSRYIVGQGRTYVRCDDADPGKIDVTAACRDMREGRVLVSYGLMADIAVVTPDGSRSGPGDLATAGDELVVELRVLGPAWTKASRITLYANGVEVREEEIATPKDRPEPAGVKWQGKWTLPKPKHDVYLVATATGPAVTEPFWPTAKPYQPTSPKFTGYVLGVTGAVRVDADRSGDFTSAREYATKLVLATDGDVRKTLERLNGYDEAVAAQAAAVLIALSGERFDRELQTALQHAAPQTQAAVKAYLVERSAALAARAVTRPATLPARPQ